MRERIRKWLGVGNEFAMLVDRDEFLLKQIGELTAKIEALSNPQPEVKREPIKQPFRVNRVPGRKLRAEQEWKHSPEYKKDIAKKQEVKALQPKGK